MKRGIARYRGDRLGAVRVEPPRPGFCTSYVDLSTERAEVEAQWNGMLDVVVDTAGEMRRSPGRPAEILASLACYLTDSQPDPFEVRGCYGRLQVLGPSLTDLGTRQLAARLGTEVRLELWDDGSAAALAEEPDEACVVLTVGTAIGVGVALPRHPRAPLADDFRLVLDEERRDEHQ